jgi:hypothetical protein
VAEPLDGLAGGLVGEPPGGQLLLEGHVRQEVQGPGTVGLAEIARGLVEDALEGFGLGRAEDLRHVLGAAFLLGQAARPLALEGVERVVDGADGAADEGGDPGGSLAVGAGQDDLGASEGERLAAAEAVVERPDFGVGQCRTKWGGFMAHYSGPPGDHQLTE